MALWRMMENVKAESKKELFYRRLPVKESIVFYTLNLKCMTSPS